MFCTKCGKVNKDEAKFCIGCGTPLSAPVREASPEMLHPAGMIAPPIMEEPAAKKKSKAPVIIAAVAAVLVLAGGGCFLMRDKLASLFGSEKSEEPSEEETEEEPVPETEAPTEAPTEPDYEQLYYDYLQEEFVPVYGLADLSDAQVTMESYGEENWLSPGGVYSAYIEDLNGDDVPEMVVFYTVLSTAFSEMNDSIFEYYSMRAALFTMEDDEVVSRSDLLAAPWVEQHETGMFMGITSEMTANESNNHFYYITAIDAGEDTYFMFESNTASAFGDGSSAYYWALRYHDGALENAFSVTKVSGGSMGFAYMLYEYEDNEVVSESVLWNDGSGSYEDAYADATYTGEFVDALKAVYEMYGITTELTDNYAYFPSGGFDAGAPEAERILEYLVSGQYNTSGVYAVDFSFTAEDHTGLREHVTYEQQMGYLQGTVVDEQTGDPVEGAYLELTSLDQQIIYSFETDADGTYAFEMETGDYEMLVTADGYAAHTDTLTIKGDIVMSGKIELEPDGASEEADALFAELSEVFSY